MSGTLAAGGGGGRREQEEETRGNARFPDVNGVCTYGSCSFIIFSNSLKDNHGAV